MSLLNRLVGFVSGNQTPDSSFYLTALSAMSIIGQALHDSGQPHMMLIGTALIGIYTIAHKVQVSVQDASDAKRAHADAISLHVKPPSLDPVKVEVPVTVNLPSPQESPAPQAATTEPTLEALADAQNGANRL